MQEPESPPPTVPIWLSGEDVPRSNPAMTSTCADASLGELPATCLVFAHPNVISVTASAAQPNDLVFRRSRSNMAPLLPPEIG